jgi:hypothetical protein
MPYTTSIMAKTFSSTAVMGSAEAAQDRVHEGLDHFSSGFLLRWFILPELLNDLEFRR